MRFDRLTFAGVAGLVPSPTTGATPMKATSGWPHEREHAERIARQFAANGTQVTTAGQIALFGIRGLIPCPVSITVLLICVQLGQVSLGVATVAAFGLGLAITMVSIGLAAAWGVLHATRRLKLSDRLLRRLPLASAALVALIGLVMLWDGLMDLHVAAV